MSVEKDDERWKQWWDGPKRPVLVLPPALYDAAKLDESLEEWERQYPGTLIIRNAPIPA